VRIVIGGHWLLQFEVTLCRDSSNSQRDSLFGEGGFFQRLQHPNFGSAINYLSSPQFGLATQMLNNYLAAAVRAAASIRFIKSAAHARSN